MNHAFTSHRSHSSVFYPFAGIFDLFVPRKPLTQQSSSGKTILLVERWFNKNIFHYQWVRFLQEKGFSVHLLHLSIQKESFYESATELKEYIDSNNLSNITLVGISVGGLTSLVYLQELDGWKHVKQFVSVATPFRGTPLILPLIFFTSCRELLPHSEFLMQLAKQELKNPDKITCMMPKFDELVPISSQTLPGVKKKIVNTYGHNNMHLHTKETYECIGELASKE